MWPGPARTVSLSRRYGGSVVNLPGDSVDANGDPVELTYSQEDDIITIGVAREGATDSSVSPGSITTYGLGAGVKCALGTGGGAGTGAIAGGAAGATIGSVVPGAGTAAGWAIGTAIGGAVSGGAVGAATFC